jgi:hypothetical protein
MEVKGFSTFGPKMLIGIGQLPGTLGSRAVGIELKRRRRDEPIERFKIRKVRPEAEPIHAQLESWGAANIDKLRELEPSELEELSDRMSDSWEPLLAIADMAGGVWPKRARDAAKVLSAGEAREDDSIGVRLLADIRYGFNDKKADKLFTADLLKHLNDIEESPWGGFGDNGMTGRDLARHLKRYAIVPKQVRIGDHTRKGYEKEWFADAWARYCPLPDKKGETSETPATAQAQKSSETLSVAQAHGNGNVSDNSQARLTPNVSLVSDKSHEKGGGMIEGEL